MLAGATLLAVLQAAPVAGAATTSAPVLGCSVAHLAPRIAKLLGGVPFLGVFSPVSTGALSSGCTTPQAASSGGAPPLVYNGGPVMATAAEGGQLTVTPVFWAPAGYSFPAGYQSVIDTYIANVAADSTKATNVFSVATQYYDSSRAHIHYQEVAGSAITDTDAFPASGCTPDTGAIYSDGTGYKACLSDAQEQAELTTLLSSRGLTSDFAHLYALFLPASVEACFGSADGAAGGGCTINAKTGSFCAYHSSFGTGPSVYAVMPFPIYNSSQGFTCDPDSAQSPNANTSADAEIDLLSHETNEAITDPTGQAWYDTSGFEEADECNFVYGALSGSNGTEFNQTINGAHYLTQEEFSNEDYALTKTAGCIQQEDLPAASFTSSSPGSAGSPVTFNASASTEADNPGSALTYSWNFGDGSALGSGVTTSHTYANSGTFTVSLTVTDVDLYSATTSQSVTVNAASSPLSSLLSSILGLISSLLGSLSALP